MSKPSVRTILHYIAVGTLIGGLIAYSLAIFGCFEPKGTSINGVDNELAPQPDPREGN